MISRCRYCGDVAPDGCTLCDSCCFLELQDNPSFNPGEEDEEMLSK